MNIPLTQYIRVLRAHLGPQWPKMALLAALLFATTGLQLASPQLLRYFIDTALAGGGGETLALTALAFLGIGLANQLASAFATYVSNDVGWSATNRLRRDLAFHCLRLDLTFHNARTPGEMIERIDGDVNALANFFSAFVVRVVGSLLLIAGVLLLLAYEDWRIGVLLGGFGAAACAGLALGHRLAIPANRAEREASAQVFGFLEERLSGIDDIRANGAGRYVLRRFYETNRALFHSGRRSWMWRGAMWTITMGLFSVANALALGLGYQLFAWGTLTLGTVYLVAHYTEMMFGPLERLTDQLQDLQRASASLDRIEELNRLRSAVPEGDGVLLPAGPLSIEFDAVTFAYPDAHAEVTADTGHDLVPGAVAGAVLGSAPAAGVDTPHAVASPAVASPAVASPAVANGSVPRGTILRDVSFAIAPGTVVGLLGRTGSGKTTVTRLLCRLYDVDEGAIRLGGVDVRAPHLAHLRTRVAVVTQDVQLFTGTLRDNLTLFDPGIPDACILAVLDDLGLTGWLHTLPDGLDTRLGAGGRGLSAGEAQLLAFTRVFLAGPSVVVLDEASSRLDPATEALVERAVDALLRDRTGLIIAHRLSTVERAGEILVLEDGRVLEHGGREALAADPASRYSTLLKTGLAEVLV